MKRLVRASKKDSEDCKKLLRLMGVPYVEVGRWLNGVHIHICCGGIWLLRPNVSASTATRHTYIHTHTSLSTRPSSPSTHQIRPPARRRRSARCWPRPRRYRNKCPLCVCLFARAVCVVIKHPPPSYPPTIQPNPPHQITWYTHTHTYLYTRTPKIGARGSDGGYGRADLRDAAAPAQRDDGGGQPHQGDRLQEGAFMLVYLYIRIWIHGRGRVRLRGASMPASPSLNRIIFPSTYD